jgi:hypothetical protein
MKDQTRFPIWQVPYENALRESDARKLAERMNAAWVAIFQRLQTMVIQPDSSNELQAMDAALTELLLLKGECQSFSERKTRSPERSSGASDVSI